MAVRSCAHDYLGGDVAAGTRPVLDDETLAKPLRQPLGHQSYDRVAGSAGRKAGDDTNRSRRIVLRASDARYDREDGSTRYQTQELSARNGHGDPPRRLSLNPGN